MRRTTLLCGLLALAANAHGEIRLFWSTTGITSSAFAYSTALTNFLPYFTAPTPIPNNELPAGSYDLFLWGKFIEEPNMPVLAFIFGLDLKFEGAATRGANVAYRQNKTGSGAYRRWAGTVGLTLDAVMTSATYRGIEFLIPPDYNNDLYYPSTREFLVGAAHVTGEAGQTKVMSLHTPDDDPPGLGIAMKWISGGNIPDPPVHEAVVTFTPEPATVVAAIGVVFCMHLLRRSVGEQP